LRLVDEKNNLKRVQTLKAVKRQFAEFNKIEESIKADIAKRKKLQDELNSSTSTPEAKALSEEFNRTRDEIAKLRSANDDAYAKRGELLTQREELQKQRDKAYEHKKNVQNEYYKQRDAYRAWNEQNRKVSYYFFVS
jgi:predicted  nucleic acid-binding Zn-ribbon protein